MGPRRTARIALAGSLMAAGLLFVTAQAAGASWLQLDTPLVPGAAVWEFTSVSCTAPHSCMAIGDSSGNSGQDLLSEIRTRSGWTIEHVPQPAPGSALLSIRCTFIYSCLAVGDAPNGSGGTVPLAERWNGSRWRIQVIPIPAGSASQLNRVTCTTALDCVAVGFASNSHNNEVPLVEHWNGKTWKIQKAPSRSGFPDNAFDGVACPTANRCIAVGDSLKPSPFKIVTLAELWNGSKWTIQKTPSPIGGGQLNAIGCPSRTHCMAVGDGFGARWNGTKWSLVKVGAPGGPPNLTAISCRPGVCYAAGVNFPGGVPTGVIEFWNGSRWHAQNAIIQTSADSSGYGGISCTTAVNCTAVGSYHDPTNGNRALAEDFTLRWQNASPQPFNNVSAAGLSAISCASPDSCMAVGTLEANSVFDTFSMTWDGTFWISQIQPKPAVTNLTAVSCRRSTFCMAVGDIVSATGLVPLAERWNGTSWVIKRPPNPPGATRSALSGVSCPSANSCTAVGLIVNGSGKNPTFAEHWNGHAWKLQHTPIPAGKFGQLNGVSCVSVTGCEAVGGTSTSVFAERWDGASWKIHATPLPTKGRDGFLNSVSCTSATACTAVGSFVHGSHVVPLAERWNGKKWTGQQAAVPGGATTSGLSAVSCTSARSCGAVGNESGSANNGFGEHWNGKHWAAESIELPFGSSSTELLGLSCNSAVACMAVGDYNGDTVILAEQFS